MPLFGWLSSDAPPVPGEQPSGGASGSDASSRNKASGDFQTPPRAAAPAPAPGGGADGSEEAPPQDNADGYRATMSPFRLARRLLSPSGTQDVQSGPTEISRDAALKRLLTDESLADVALKGTDGVQVFSSACLLAARSDTFRSLLYDDSDGGGESTQISIGYKGCVLQAVVEYVLTDTAALATPVIANGEDADFSAAAERARSIVSVVDAAKYFLLPNLGKMAEECAKAEMRNNAPLACVYLSAAAELKITDLEEAAMDVVRGEVHFDLRDHKMAMELLSSDALRLILEDEYCEADERGLFVFLCAWVGTGSGGDDAEKERRKTVASKFVQHIKLEEMDPSDLADIVSSSGLVTDEEMLEAYKQQALASGGCVVS